MNIKILIIALCGVVLMVLTYDALKNFFHLDKTALILENQACLELKPNTPLQVLVGMFGPPAVTVEHPKTTMLTFASDDYARLFREAIVAEVDKETQNVIALSCGRGQKVY